MKKHGTHLFALYHSSLSLLLSSSTSTVLIITDNDFIRRITRVLRLQVRDKFIMFDRTQHIFVQIEAITHNNQLVCRQDVRRGNTYYKPCLEAYLPLLKRDAFEQALYALVELGVNVIQPIITEKAQVHYCAKDYERFERIMISAAEQAKHFAFPALPLPISFNVFVEVIKKENKTLICADPTGILITECLHKVSLASSSSLAFVVGPEADLSGSEKVQLIKAGAIVCRLTPTVLRSQDAIACLAGILRSSMTY